ncbi:MAG: VWA domain-containing protein [Lachnospiraceae bacterium]|nr:VWA domain-containing protein [Lachnospiraceae bacterium]
MRDNRKNRPIYRFLAVLLTLALILGTVSFAKPAAAAEGTAEADVVEEIVDVTEEKEEAEESEEAEIPEETKEEAEESSADVVTEETEAEETEAEEEAEAEEAVETEAAEETEAAAEETVAEETKAEVEETEAEETKAEAEETEAEETVAEETVAEETEDETEAEVKETEEETIAEETEEEEVYIPKTKVYTKAGPFLPPVAVGPSANARRLKAMTKGGLRPMGNDTQTPDGLGMSKTATPKEGGGYTLTLEAYTTGTVTSEEVSVPVDIVLVLDQSGSMQFDFDGNENVPYSQSRQKAMQDAVKNFITAVAEKYDAENSDHRISIVTFGSNSSVLQGWTDVDAAGVATLTSAIDGLPDDPEGATNAGAGMGNAQRLLIGNQYSYDGPNETRQKVAIMFTDGIPTTGTAFSLGVANGAINAAKNLKNAGATVYSVGIFTGADPAQLYGDSGFDQNSNGTVGSTWGNVGFLFFGDMDAVDIPAGNRFLNYLSSNFANTTEIGLDDASWSFIIRYHGWEITKNFSRTTNGYYLTANDSTSLNNIFQNISEQISTPTISLGTGTVVKDIVAPQFAVPEGSTVRFYTQPYQGNDSWGTRVQVTDGSVHLVEGTSADNVSVTGFDFDANCITEEPKQDGSHGNKLIIEIEVEPDPYFLGGTVTTNGPDSGIVDEDGNTIAYFDNPTVSEPAKQLDPNVQNHDVSIYLTQTADPADLVSIATMTLNGGEDVPITTLFNGINNAGVMFEVVLSNGTDSTTLTIPAESVVTIEDGKIVVKDKNGNPVGGWNIPALPEGEYTITTKVTDIGDLSNSQETTHQVTSHVYVFKPVLNFEDKHAYYMGGKVDVTAEEDWKCETASAPEPEGEAPTLTYTINGMTGEKVDFTEDFEVKLADGKVMIGETDVTADTTFNRSCTSETLTDAEKSPEGTGVMAKIHVYLPDYSFEDMSAYYGEKLTFGSALGDYTWTDANGETAGSSMDNEAPSVAMGLDNGHSIDSQDYVVVKEDFPVKATIYIDDVDVTAALIEAGRIHRSCEEDASHTEVTADQALVVHVKTLKLTVKKVIEGLFADMTARYNFTIDITHPSAEIADQNLTALLGNGETKEFLELPVDASFTVTETDAKDNYTVTITSEGSRVTQNEDAATGTLTKDTVVTVTNKLEEIPATGIKVETLTFSVGAMILVFGCMAILYLKRRRAF